MVPAAVSKTGKPNVSVSKSISEAHANMLYTKWTINDEDGFNVWTFARFGAVVACGAYYVVLGV